VDLESNRSLYIGLDDDRKSISGADSLKYNSRLLPLHLKIFNPSV